MATEYPKRESHWAHKLVRLLFRTCAPSEIGSDACLLVTCIAHTEDAAHYRGPVTYWNDQLQSLFGWTWGKLDRARRKAIRAGWLHYEPGGKGKVGKYWVDCPERFNGLPDHPIDEDFILTREDTNILSSPPVEIETQVVSPPVVKEAGEKRGRSGGETRDKCGTFFPDPVPDPSPKKARCARRDVRADESNFIATWNAARGARKIRGSSLSKARRTSFLARCRSEGWLDEYVEALLKFPLGHWPEGRNGWKPTVEWFLKPDTVTKILEGQYDGPPPGETDGRTRTAQAGGRAPTPGEKHDPERPVEAW